jgi:hypothetical protein
VSWEIGSNSIEVTCGFSRWDFKCHAHDIKFGVRAINQKTGEKFNEVDLKRVASSEGDESGFITCQPSHKCE